MIKQMIEVWTHELAQTLAQTDPTGFSSTTGKLVVAAMLLGALVVLIRWLVQLRRRDRDR